MSHNFVVTSGETFVDIDAYACAVAYAELLCLEGKQAEVVIPGVLNSSITPSLKALGLTYVTTPSQLPSKYVIVDVSDPEFIAKCAAVDDIVEIYDHHPGFEAYWSTRLGYDAHIEPIGACATLIWEEFKKRGKDAVLSEKSAQLLVAAIVSNTLNFGAVITHQRDHNAYRELSQRVHLSQNWIQAYFCEQEQTIRLDLTKAIASDTKVLTLPHSESPVVVGQLELWDGGVFLQHQSAAVKATLETFGHPHWIMSIPSLSERKNHFYCEHPELKAVFERGLGIRFEGDYASSDRLWLRKEILKKFGEFIY